MCKIDAHEYQTVKEFLADVKLMSSNALEYNPSTYNEERLIRHRACLAVGKCPLLIRNPIKFIKTSPTNSSIMSSIRISKRYVSRSRSHELSEEVKSKRLPPFSFSTFFKKEICTWIRRDPENNAGRAVTAAGRNPRERDQRGVWGRRESMVSSFRR